MTTLSFDAGYAAFHSDSALFGRPFAMPAIVRHVSRLAASRQSEAAAAFAGRAALALVPFSALAWMFVAR